MKRVKITSEIEYVESAKPGSKLNFCGGIVVHSSPAIVIDTYVGKEATLKLFREVKPDFAIADHFHIDHSVILAIAANNTDAGVFAPAGEEDYFGDVMNYARQVAPGNADLHSLLAQQLVPG